MTSAAGAILHAGHKIGSHLPSRIPAAGSAAEGEAWKDLQMVMKYLGLKPRRRSPTRSAVHFSAIIAARQSLLSSEINAPVLRRRLPVPLDMVFTYRVAAETHVQASQQTLSNKTGRYGVIPKPPSPSSRRVLVPSPAADDRHRSRTA